MIRDGWVLLFAMMLGWILMLRVEDMGCNLGW